MFRDILLGLMKRLIKMRASNLKVLITSATLDGEKVSKFFCDCPILNVPGKLFPVEILYTSDTPKSYLESSLKAAIGMIGALVFTSNHVASLLSWWLCSVVSLPIFYCFFFVYLWFYVANCSMNIKFGYTFLRFS